MYNQPLPLGIEIYKDIIAQNDNVLYNKTLYCILSYDVVWYYSSMYNIANKTHCYRINIAQYDPSLHDIANL